MLREIAKRILLFQATCRTKLATKVACDEAAKVAPCMVALRIVIEKVSSLVNEDKCHDLGAHMIEVACKAIEEDADLFRTFVRCSDKACIDVVDPAVAVVLPRLHKELSKKMFHARVNEYMTASVEIELERRGKAVEVEQSLRDQLKTFSGLKTR